MHFNIKRKTYDELEPKERLHVWMLAKKITTVGAEKMFARSPSTISKWRTGMTDVPKDILTMMKADLDAADIFID